MWPRNKALKCVSWNGRDDSCKILFYKFYAHCTVCLYSDVIVIVVLVDCKFTRVTNILATSFYISMFHSEYTKKQEAQLVLGIANRPLVHE